MWDLIVSVPDHCLSFYFSEKKRFCELIFKTRVKVNVHPLRFWLRLILVVTVH